MRAPSTLAVVGLLLCLPSGSAGVSGTPGTSQSTLFAQSAARKLESEFHGCRESAVQNCGNDEVSFLLLDVRTGAVLASRWQHADAPIPLGSLVKPLAALAYGERHQFQYPKHVCRGTVSGCWLPHGHGQIDLTAAIAQSCNSYFRMLTAYMTASDLTPLVNSLGLQAPSAAVSGVSLAGIGDTWQISPVAMANVYIELVRRRDQPGVRQIVAGMQQSGEQGTGAGVDRALGGAEALVKTGTAACTHERRAPGDGFVIALTPAADPQILLMVRVHGVPGAQAANVAGRLLREIEQ